MPASVLVLVGDARGLPGSVLLAGRPLCGASSVFAAGKGLRVDSIRLVRPPAVMLDDLVRDLAHLTLPTGQKISRRNGPAFSETGLPELQTRRIVAVKVQVQDSSRSNGPRAGV